MIERRRLRALHQLAVVPALVRADAERGRGGAGRQIDREAGLVGDLAGIRELPLDAHDGDAVLEPHVDGVRHLEHRLLARCLQRVGGGEGRREQGCDEECSHVSA